MTAKASRVADVFAKAHVYEPGLQGRGMAGITPFSRERVHRGERTAGVWFRVPSHCMAEQPKRCNRGKGDHEPGTKQPPSPPPLKVVEVVSLSEALGCAFAGHGSVSVRQSDHRMNRSHYEQG